MASMTEGSGANLVMDPRVGRARVAVGDRVVAEYVYVPTDAPVESPRPYFHPVRTLGGREITAFRPGDHVWHKGISWALPFVGNENFWGGPTFSRDDGRYVQLANNGAQLHRGFAATDLADRLTHSLGWVTEQGQAIIEERRTIAVALAASGAWTLAFRTDMRNVSGEALSLGSPTTRGRPDAGYGGLFWRGPADLEGARVLAPAAEGGDELRGSRAPWMAYSAGGGGDGVTLVAVDDSGNVGHPTEWFVRTTEYAGLCPAPFFSTEYDLAADATLTLRYAFVIADGASDSERAASLAAAGAALAAGI